MHARHCTLTDEVPACLLAVVAKGDGALSFGRDLSGLVFFFSVVSSTQNPTISPRAKPVKPFLEVGFLAVGDHAGLSSPPFASPSDAVCYSMLS